MSATQPERDAESATPRLAEAVALVLVLATGVGYLVVAFQLSLGTWERPSSGAFPVVVGVLLVVAASVALGQLMIRWSSPANRRDQSAFGTGGAFWRVPVLTGVLFGYLILVGWLGHLVTSALACAAVIRVLGRRPWWQIALTGVGLALLTVLLFEDLLGMRLPSGTLL